MKSDLWAIEGKKKIENEDAWVDLSIKEDKEKGQYLYVLGGNKHKKEKFHWNTYLDQSTHYIESREILKSIKREAVSKKHGKFPDEEITFESNKDVSFNFILKLEIDGTTKEIKIIKFDFTKNED